VWRLLKGLLSRCAPEVFSERHATLPSEGELLTLLSRVRPYTMLSDERLVCVYDQVVHAETSGIEGSFVECGAWRGGCAGLMALANLAHGVERRQIHLFDSFSGIPEPDASVDGPRAILEARRFGVEPRGRLVSQPQFYRNMGRQTGSLSDCRHLLEALVGYPAGFISYHQGFFEETVPAVAGQTAPIALLHLDGDWYSSTKVCLDHLYDLMVPGGLVTVDDYGAYEGCRKAVDAFLQERGLRPFMHRVDREVRVFRRD